MVNRSSDRAEPEIHRQRWQLLEQINRATDWPLVALAFVWLALLVVDFTRGLSPLLQTVSNIIWVVFILDFLIEITIAPRKLDYMRRNWLTAISLLLPALRVFRLAQSFRILRAARAVRSLSLVRLLTSVNRGMGALGRTLGRRGIGFVLALTIIVTFAGAAGMYLFENAAALRESGLAGVAQQGGLNSYGEALWWTAMLMTTMGSDYSPKTIEGRVLTWLLALYAFTVFGYITATIASHFIGQDRLEDEGQPITSSEIQALRLEIAALQTQLAGLSSLKPIQYPKDVDIV